MRAPGNLLASGRDSDIFEYGPRQVLRRSRHGRSQLTEARTMEYLRSQGYPVPEVIEIDATGRDLVMERVDGVTMVDSIAKAPWTLRRQARQLASLHQQLHAIEPPTSFEPHLSVMAERWSIWTCIRSTCSLGRADRSSSTGREPPGATPRWTSSSRGC